MPNSRHSLLQAAISHGPWLAALGSLTVTPIGYAVIALVLERRAPRPHSDFTALIYGDPLLALTIALGVWLLRGHVPSGIASPRLGLASLAAWFGFGLLQWWGEVRGGFYTLSQALSPTKLWHQLVVYPALGYWTWVAGLGGLIAGGNANDASRIAAKAGMLLCTIGWLIANGYDRKHPKLGHPPYDWRRLRPHPQPWLLESVSLRAYASYSSG